MLLKQIARVSLVAMLLLLLAVQPSDARGGSGGGSGAHGGASGGQGGGWGGHSGGSGGHRGGHHHHHGHSAVVFGVGVGVGPWWWGGPGWWWGAPGWGWPGYYPGWYYPPVVEQPTTYIQGPSQPTGFWYYCPSAQAYYPQTATCDEPWVKVPPRQQ